MEDASMHIGQRVKQVRERRGLTQRDLERETGVPQSAISQIESGERPSPGVDVVKRTAYALGVTTDFLIGMHELYEKEESGETESVVPVP